MPYKDKEKRNECASRSKCRQRKELRLKIQAILGDDCVGPTCQWQGTPPWYTLEVDHPNGGGKAELRRFNRDYIRYYKHVLRQLKKDPNSYQLLCCNCNKIKVHENKEIKRKYPVRDGFTTDRITCTTFAAPRRVQTAICCAPTPPSAEFNPSDNLYDVSVVHNQTCEVVDPQYAYFSCIDPLSVEPLDLPLS